MATDTSTAYDTGHLASRHSAIDRLRRSLEQVRRESDNAHPHRVTADDELDLRVQLMLLREENARLKSELYRSGDIGTVVERLRALASETCEPEAGDQAMGLLAQALAVGAGIERACLELESAAAMVRARLEQLSLGVEQVEFHDALDQVGDGNPLLA